MAPATRPIDAPAVSEGGWQTPHENVPVIARPMAPAVQRELGKRPIVIEGINDQGDGRAIAAQEREVDAVG